MKKRLVVLLSLSMLCLFLPTLGASQTAESEVINGNTYIYPNGFTDTPNSDIIINKPYTDEQVRQAEEALEPIFKSFYLSNDKTLCDHIAAAESFQNDCKYENWTPDFSTLCAMYGFDDINAFPQTGTVSEALQQPSDTYYRMLTRSTNGGHGGDLFIYDDYSFGYGLFASSYITEDMRTHAVALYALLKDSGLDLSKTTAKFFQIGDVGRFYLFMDETAKFVVPVGYQFDFSPYENGEGYPDASSSFQLVCGENFIKAMIKVEQNMEAAAAEAAKSYSGSPQMGGAVKPDAPAPNHLIFYIAVVCFAVAAASVVVFLIIRKKRVTK